MSLGTYSQSDVCLLLREDPSLDIVSIEEKEKRMADGRHYSEILSEEYDVSDDHFFLYRQVLSLQKEWLARASLSLARMLCGTFASPVFISLVRAGLPFGCLLKRAAESLGYIVPHYGVSIFRDRGIDRNAMRDIKARHPGSDCIFLDGWTGKGLIANELRLNIPEAFLAVFSDPCGAADLSVTHEDVCLSFGMLNGAVSGSISRSVWNSQEDGYHRCHVFSFRRDESRFFLDTVSELFEKIYDNETLPLTDRDTTRNLRTTALLRCLEKKYDVSWHEIKAGVCEAGRAVMRRKPKKILFDTSVSSDCVLVHLLAGQKNIPVISEKIFPYKCIALL